LEDAQLCILGNDDGKTSSTAGEQAAEEGSYGL
jgi:hypothetical protein